MKIELPEKVFGLDSQIIKISILPIGLVVGMIISLIVVGSSKIPEIQAQFKKIDTLVNGRKQYESKKNYLTNIDQEAIARDSEFLNMALLKNKDAYILVNVIRNVVSKYGYQIDSFSITPGQVAETVEEQPKTAKKKVAAKENELIRIPVNLTMMGPKENYMSVVEAIETTLPILLVGKMDFKSDNSVGTITMTVYSYFSTDKTDIKLASLSIGDLTLTQAENDLIKNISEFNKMEGMSTDDSGLIKGKEYTDYNRDNPFNF